MEHRLGINIAGAWHYLRPESKEELDDAVELIVEAVERSSSDPTWTITLKDDDEAVTLYAKHIAGYGIRTENEETR